MAKRRGANDSGRTGVLVVDKPTGMTSHDVVAQVRRAAGTRRVGHTGTLDPDATGVLICCVGQATRLVQFLQDSPKTYQATMVLGLATSTQDAAGEPIFEADASSVDEGALCTAFSKFNGEILQVPPMVSALKIDGERLHEKARRGEVVERAPRPVTIHDLVLEEFLAGERAYASFLVTCSPGTYVRTLAHDIGEMLGVGGSLTALRRLANGGFTSDMATPLDEVMRRGEDGTIDELLLTCRDALRGYPQVEVDDATVRGLVHGGRLPAQGVDGVYGVIHDDRLVGVYRDEDGAGKAQVVLLQPSDLASVDESDPVRADSAGGDAA